MAASPSTGAAKGEATMPKVDSLALSLVDRLKEIF